MKIAVVGTGYADLPNTTLLAPHNQVRVFDTDAEVAELLKPMTLSATLDKSEADIFVVHPATKGLVDLKNKVYARALYGKTK